MVSFLWRLNLDLKLGEYCVSENSAFIDRDITSYSFYYFCHMKLVNCVKAQAAQLDLLVQLEKRERLEIEVLLVCVDSQDLVEVLDQ